MKEVSVKVFGAAENEAVDLLEQMGLSRKLAKALLLVGNQPGSTQSMIERATGMQQPATSMALAEAYSLGWVEGRKMYPATGSKGRPAVCYSLTKPLSEIISYLAERRRAKIQQDREHISKLKAYVGS